MVGGLVQDHDVGHLEEDPEEVDPAPLAAREVLDVLQQEVLGQADAVGQAGHDGLRLVPAVRAVLLLQVGEPLDVLHRGVLGHLPPGAVEGVVQDVEAAGGEHVGEAAGFQPQPLPDRRLRQVAQGAGHPDVARGPDLGRRLAHQHGHEGRLAGPVAPHQARLLPGAHGERAVPHQHAAADLDGEGGPGDHRLTVGWRACSRTRWPW